jgi:hypothetical protein
MESGQRRVTRKGSGQFKKRIPLIIAPMLAFCAGTFFVLTQTDRQIDAFFIPEFASDCSSVRTSATTAECETAVTGAASAQTIDGALTNNTSLDFDAEYVAESSGRSESQDTVTVGSDDRPFDHLIRAGLQPGQTLFELCVPGLEGSRPHCSAGLYDEAIARLAPDGESDAGTSRAIAGRVLTDDGVGLPGVSIIARPKRLKAGGSDAPGNVRFWTVSDGRGRYSLDDLPEGEYTIRSRAKGPYPSKRISARTGVDYADLVLSQKSTVLVEGQVFGSAGDSLEGVTVLPLALGQPSVLTDDTGRFRLPMTLKPSVRHVGLRFQRPGYHEQSTQVEFKTLEVSSATAPDVVLHPVETWTSVSGTVYSDSGNPLAGLTVELRPDNGQQAYRTATDRWGHYSFPAVECPAEYRLSIFGGSRFRDYHEPVRITADMGALDVITESYEFGEVAGQLVNVNGEPVPDFELVLRNVDSRKANTLVSTDEFGNFAIPEVPAGELVVASQSTPAILVQGLQLRAGDRLHLPLVLDWGKHEIRGTVVDASGSPVAASRIVLQWSHSADGISMQATRRTAADLQGQFAFSNLGPGPHSLRIDAPGFSPVAIDHDLSRSGYGVTVRLN